MSMECADDQENMKRNRVLSRSTMFLLLGVSFGFSCNFFMASIFDHVCLQSWRQRSLSGIDENRGTIPQPNPTEEVFEVRHRLKEYSKQELDQMRNQNRTKRPRFLGTELGIREKIYVGVVTSPDSIETFGVAVNKTLNHLLPKLVFFMNNPGKVSLPGMSLVMFSDSRSHMIPFHALKYLIEHHLDAYDWFFVFPDTTYVSGNRLLELVRGISADDDLLIGKPVNVIKGRASSCDLQAGVLISQVVMKLLSQHIDWCMKESMEKKTDSDNMNTCLSYLAENFQISCTDQINDLKYPYFPNITLNPKSTERRNNQQTPDSKAIFIGPLHEEKQFYRLHRELAEQDINEKRTVLDKFKDEIAMVAPSSPAGNKSIVWPHGTEPPSGPIIRFDLRRWQYFTDTLIFFQDDFTNVEKLKGVNKLDISDIIKTSLNHINSSNSKRFIHKRILNGYRRFDASRGMEYVVDLLLADQHTSRDCVKRVHLVRPTGNAEIIPMPYLTEARQITIVLPIFPEKWNMVTEFVDKFVANCLAIGDDSQLLVVFVEQSAGKQNGSKQHTGDTYRKMNSTLTGYQTKYKAQKTIKWMRVTVGSLYKASFAVMDAVSARLQSDSLVVMGSAGMSVAVEYLNRVRLNTIIGQQVFFPIGYWSFKPNLVSDHPPSKSAKILLNSKSGHYDKDQYSHSSFYISDYLFARNQMRDAVRTTLKDTRELFDMFLNFHTLHVLRAVEPELRLQYRPVRCTGSSRDLIEADCWRSRSHALASGPQLALLILQHQDKLPRKGAQKAKQ